MKIAVTIPTYRRLDNKTPFYLNRCLDSIFKQTYSDFKVFLVGDYYDNQAEWEGIVAGRQTKKMWSINLSTPGERDKYKDDKVALWCSGGTKACNYAIDKAIEEGYDYICHMDHDDWWADNHLQLINDCIETNGADFICTKSTYGKGKILLPLGEHRGDRIPFFPFPAGLVNSSSCYNYKTIPLRGEDTMETLGRPIPADAFLWERMYKYMVENQRTGFLINKLTCFHNEEGHTYR